MDASGADSLLPEAQKALYGASIIIGPERHLSMLPDVQATQICWPTPFEQGIQKLISYRGKPVVMLVSGDPFWFGAGTQIARHLAAEEWVAWPGMSCFSLAASKLGWAIEHTKCLGLHAASLHRLRPYLRPGQHIMATLRNGDAVQELAAYLTETDFGRTKIEIFEQLGGKQARITSCNADALPDRLFHHPVMVGLHVAGDGKVMPRATGLANSWFAHDGQITKQSIRAMTLSALAPVSGQNLWDLGAGCGSIGIEWLLQGRSMQASAVEQNSDRIQLIKQNARQLGVDWLNILHSDILSALPQLDKPDAVFIGGGLSPDLLDQLWAIVPSGTRIVANAVTLQTDRILTQAYERHGGELQRMEMASITAIGRMQGWKSAYPITQWTVIR